jgi:methionyl aminopeptidase
MVEIDLIEKAEKLDLEDNEEGVEEEVNPDASAPAKKKKKKRKPKRKGARQQTSPPSVPLPLLFPDNVYPKGEICSYKDDNLWRETNEEKRAAERLMDDGDYNDIRRAAEVHRQVNLEEFLRDVGQKVCTRYDQTRHDYGRNLRLD